MGNSESSKRSGSCFETETNGVGKLPLSKLSTLSTSSILKKISSSSGFGKQQESSSSFYAEDQKGYGVDEDFLKMDYKRFQTKRSREF